MMSRATALGLGLVGLVVWGVSRAKPKKKKRKKKKKARKQEPVLGCGLYPWLPDSVDTVLGNAIKAGERDVEALVLVAARRVYPSTPEGDVQQWPAASGDARAKCLEDRIRIRANLRLAEVADQEVDGAPSPARIPDGPGNCPAGTRWDRRYKRCLKRRTGPRKPGPRRANPSTSPTTVPLPLPFPFPLPIPAVPDGVDAGTGEEQWPDYPPMGPVDLAPLTDPSNYPTPGRFHQIGGENSGTTLKKIARLALTTAYFKLLGDFDEADLRARRSASWRAYRDLINCAPWNHALYGSKNQPGPYYYDTPHGDHISMYPVHGRIRQALEQGEMLVRLVDEEDPKSPAGGVHAFIWLPPLDLDALAEDEILVSREYWYTGDSMIMPPPEVVTFDVDGIPESRQWGCLGFAAGVEDS